MAAIRPDGGDPRGLRASAGRSPRRVARGRRRRSHRGSRRLPGAWSPRRRLPRRPRPRRRAGVNANGTNGGELPARHSLVRGAERGDQHAKARPERFGVDHALVGQRVVKAAERLSFPGAQRDERRAMVVTRPAVDGLEIERVGARLDRVDVVPPTIGTITRRSGQAGDSGDRRPRRVGGRAAEQLNLLPRPSGRTTSCTLATSSPS